MEIQSQGLYLSPFQSKLLRKSLETNLRPEYRRRVEIMLLADAGQSQTQICEALGCAQETARHWIAIAQTGNAHHWNDRPMGRPKTVNQQYLQRLKDLATNSPREYGYSFKRWTGRWLSIHLAKEFEIEISSNHVNRLLKQMNISTRQQTSNNAEDRNNQNPRNSILISDLKSEVTIDSIEFLFITSNLLHG